MATLRRFILILLAATCLAGATMVLPVVDAKRGELGSLSFAGPDPTRPEIVLLTNLLGGFRGLLVNAVWLRANKLQQEGKFWELYQLYDWMGKLQPRIEEIWVFNAWNMAYNLVVELPDSEARWQWIQRAIAWLRDDGLKYNPRSGKIMKEIAWIYFQKIGRDLDLHHHYYKHRLALDMHAILLDRERQDTKGWAEAPERLEELLADPDVSMALSRFQLDPPEEIIAFLDEAEGLHMIPTAIIRALRDSNKEEVGRKVRNYVTARILRTKFKRDRLDLMADMEDTYGKFDWRLPEPHALYWGMRGAETDPNFKNQLHYDRLVLFSLQETMRRGVIAYMGVNPIEPMYTAFDLSKLAPLDALYERMLMKYPWAGQEERAATLRDGHTQFLQDAAFNLYFAGYHSEALKYYKKLNDLYDKPQPRKTMEVYLLGRVRSSVDEHFTRAKMEMFVDGLISRTAFYLCTNQPAQARKWENFAKRAWEAFREFTLAQMQDPDRYASVKDGRLRGSGLPAFRDKEREIVRNILAGRSAFPRNLLPVLHDILGVKKENIEEYTLPGEGIIPQIPPSSPPPE